MGFNSAFKGLIFACFSKTRRENSTFITIRQEYRVPLHEDRYTFLIIPRSVLLRMRNVSDKSCTENQITHFVFSNFSPENRTVYEIMWKNVVERGQATDDNMAHAHCMPGT